MKNKLTLLRKEHGIHTAEQMAKKLDMPVWTYRNYESGKTPMSLELAYMIAKVLDCTIDEVASATLS